MTTRVAGEDMATAVEIERWRDFANRMACVAWPNATDARKHKIRAAVRDFIVSVANDHAPVDDWDGEGDSICVGDELMDFLDDRGYLPDDVEKSHKFSNQISCCVRAGFDVAVNPSAGVLGFDVGVLRRMWREGPPDWVCQWFEPPLTPDVAATEPIWL